jgi:uncharacterized protein YkwD
MIKDFFIPTKKNSYKPYLLNKVAIVIYSFVLIFVNSFGGLVGLSQVQASSITQANVINLTNQERLGHGLNTLSTNPQLSAAALAKANDMLEKQYWDHFGPNGESPWQFIRAAGYDYVYAGENLAKGFRTAEGIHEAWMASPTHKANIVSGNYKDIGVAVVEGELLGKQTTLVVQMFGNLTDEVQGATEDPVEEPSLSSSSEEKVVVNKEVGEIKSIRITSPQDGSIVTDPSVSVKGEAANAGQEYVVEVYDEDSLVGDSTANSVDWEFVKGSDWEEGDHRVFAQLKGEDVKSNEVGFKVDSRAPVVITETITSKKGDDGMYTISFQIEGEWDSIVIVSGSEIIEVEYEEQGDVIVILMSQEQVKGAVTLVLSDEQGNTSELDITEYFIEEETKEKTVFPSILLSTGDKISIGIVSFILVLILIEIFMYWRRGNIKDILGDVFTVGVWWIILTIAILNGFSGVIN